MNASIDLGLIFIQCLVLAYYSGRFSEKITGLDKKVDKIFKILEDAGGSYYSIKDGAKLEQKVDALHERVDSQERLLAASKLEFFEAISKHNNSK